MLLPGPSVYPGAGTLPGLLGDPPDQPPPPPPSGGPLPGPFTLPGADLLPGGPPTGSRRYVFHPPTIDVYFRIAGRGLIGTQQHGQSVWREPGGAWRVGLSPLAETVAAASRFYRGGYAHPLTLTERAELYSAGFGPHIIETEEPS